MMLFSRGQRGSPRVLRLDHLVQEALPALRSQMPAAVDCALQIDAGAMLVSVDPVQLEQVLLNLAVNARDAVGASGRVLVGVNPSRPIRGVCAGCRAPLDSEYVELYVADDGPGIEGGVAERIFEPFFTTKETGKGTGMGLAIVHGIVHEHGGHVLLETAPGRGARFRVLLPGASPQQASEDVAHSNASPRVPAPALSGRVLVVDDEASVAQFMRELLETWGLEVDVVGDGATALAAIQSAPARYDVVVTDQAMPRMTGLELVQRLRAVRADLPIVIHTGNVDAMPPWDIDAARPSAVLQKPVDPARLRGELQRCLQASRPPPGTPASV
jgi:CheY-like chemotaxis protein